VVRRYNDSLVVAHHKVWGWLCLMPFRPCSKNFITASLPTAKKNSFCCCNHLSNIEDNESIWPISNMPLSAERAFSYTALINHDDIRFVILHPGAFSSPIQINITQTSLGRKRPYEALSYTWGDPKTLRPVAIRGQKRCSLYITENLEAALRHLRYTDKIRVLWVDALSINQNDLKERSLQVMRMGEIFS
jgi:hypothetical protein